MTVRERALELLHEVSGLLEQLLGEVDEAESDSADPAPKIDPEPASEADPLTSCPQGGDHVPMEYEGSIYCERCNALIPLED